MIRLAQSSEELISLYESGKSLKQIESLVGASCGTIRNRLVAVGVKLRSPGQTSKLRSAKLDRRCSVPNCERRHLAHGYCEMHYDRWKKFGSPAKTVRMHRRHGMKRNPLYTIWSKMLDRCRNYKNKDYASYGGRGITVCERWEDAAKFIEDMPQRPAGTTLDRIDNNGPYSPQNCKWSTPVEQVRNSRQTKLTQEKARKVRELCESCHLQAEIAEMFGVSQTTVSSILTGRTWREE